MRGFKSGDAGGNSDSEGGLGFERFRAPIKADLKATNTDNPLKTLFVGSGSGTEVVRIAEVDTREALEFNTEHK